MSQFSAIPGIAFYLAFVTLGINALAMITNAIVAALAMRNVRLLSREVRQHARNDVVAAHRELFMSIISDPALCDLASEGRADNYRRKMLGSILITNCARIFADYQHNMLADASTEEFSGDAISLFSMPLVRQRWSEVKMLHTKSFREFIDTKVIDVARSEGTPANQPPPASYN